MNHTNTDAEDDPALSNLPWWIDCSAMICARSQVLYVPTPKVACTSLKWMLADHERAIVSPRQDRTGLPTHAMSIHSMDVNRVTRLGHLSEPDRLRVLTDDEWVRFCVTREPCERLLSAWVNRILLVPHPFIRLSPSFEKEEGLDIRAEFRAFVHDLAENQAEFFTDDHLRPQVEHLQIGRFPYTEVVDLPALDKFLDGLRNSHPRRQSLGPLGRSNSSPSFPARAMFDRETVALVEEIYAADYARLGYRPLEADPAQHPVFLSRNEIILIKDLRDRAERVVDMAKLLTEYEDFSSIRGASRAFRSALRRRLAREISRVGKLGQRVDSVSA